MPEMKVGSTYSIGKETYICMEIDTRQSVKIAEYDSNTQKEHWSSYHNTKQLCVEVEDFKEGDIIEVEQQQIKLVNPGKNIFFILPYSKARKVRKEDGSESSQGSNGKASDDEVKDSGEGDLREGSEGAEVVGEIGHPVDGG